MDDLLVAMIIAGIGLSGAYLRAELILRLGTKAAQQRDDLNRCELHAHTLTLMQKDPPAAALRIHQHFLSKESGNRPDSATAQLTA